jgi:hypothetical protein
VAGETHWEVEWYVRERAERLCELSGGTWNTYVDHPPGYGLDSTSIDLWGPGGRGDPLDEAAGDAAVAWALGQHQIHPIAWLIWYSWWWRPRIGWMRYSGWQGNHGPGTDAHVHITYA